MLNEASLGCPGFWQVDAMSAHRQLHHIRPVSRRGLARLMLKLPAHRGQLAAVAESSIVLDELFEIYELAAAALDGFRRKGNPDLAKEYAETCVELEGLVLRDLRELPARLGVQRSQS